MGLEKMELIFETVGVCAGAVVSLWGVVKIVAAISRFFREKRGRQWKEMEVRLEEIREDLGKIRSMEQANSDAIATLQCESLSHIFAEYVEKGKPCPISVKQAVAAMYEEYTKDARHNHVAKDYLERLMSLPAE